MSILSEINRIKTAKDAIKQSIVAKGVAVDENAKLSAFPSLIDTIHSEQIIENPNKWKVIFIDYDRVITEYELGDNEDIIYPDAPKHPELGIEFVKWTSNYTNTSELAEYSSMYSKHKYIVIGALYNNTNNIIKYKVTPYKKYDIPEGYEYGFDEITEDNKGICYSDTAIISSSGIIRLWREIVWAIFKKDFIQPLYNTEVIMPFFICSSNKYMTGNSGNFKLFCKYFAIDESITNSDFLNSIDFFVDYSSPFVTLPRVSRFEGIKNDLSNFNFYNKTALISTNTTENITANIYDKNYMCYIYFYAPYALNVTFNLNNSYNSSKGYKVYTIDDWGADEYNKYTQKLFINLYTNNDNNIKFEIEEDSYNVPKCFSNVNNIYINSNNKNALLLINGIRYFYNLNAIYVPAVQLQAYKTYTNYASYDFLFKPIFEENERLNYYKILETSPYVTDYVNPTISKSFEIYTDTPACEFIANNTDYYDYIFEGWFNENDELVSTNRIFNVVSEAKTVNTFIAKYHVETTKISKWINTDEKKTVNDIEYTKQIDPSTLKSTVTVKIEPSEFSRSDSWVKKQKLIKENYDIWEDNSKGVSNSYGWMKVDFTQDCDIYWQSSGEQNCDYLVCTSSKPTSPSYHSNVIFDGKNKNITTDFSDTTWETYHVDHTVTPTLYFWMKRDSSASKYQDTAIVALPNDTKITYSERWIDSEGNILEE